MHDVTVPVDELSDACWLFRESVVTMSNAVSMSASGDLGVGPASMLRLNSSQESGAVPAIASFVTAHVPRLSFRQTPSRAKLLDSGSAFLTRSLLKMGRQGPEAPR